jgi:hypothetical protein
MVAAGLGWVKRRDGSYRTDRHDRTDGRNRTDRCNRSYWPNRIPRLYGGDGCDWRNRSRGCRSRRRNGGDGSDRRDRRRRVNCQHDDVYKLYARFELQHRTSEQHIPCDVCRRYESRAERVHLAENRRNRGRPE